jgi:hypothetical protein
MNIEANQAHRADSFKARYPLMDKRTSVRVYGAFPVRMRGLDESCCAFKANSLVDNIGGGGLYMQLARPVALGSKMFVAVQLTSGITIAARSVVARVEKRAHGLSGVALRFAHSRLLPAQTASEAASDKRNDSNFL